MIIDIFITCWIVLMSDGSAYCYCEGETPPPLPVVEVLEEFHKPKVEPAPTY